MIREFPKYRGDSSIIQGVSQGTNCIILLLSQNVTQIYNVLCKIVIRVLSSCIFGVTPCIVEESPPKLGNSLVSSFIVPSGGCPIVCCILGACYGKHAARVRGAASQGVGGK